MCLPIDERAMVSWLRSQVRVMEAWREALASQPDIDLNQVQRLEEHYHWLTGEIAQLERDHRVAVTTH
ncbi:MAG: hypothetical protein AAF253_06035 [Pseudomonadota bacterium]